MKTETILYNYSFCILETHSTETYLKHNFSPRRAIYSFADFTGYYVRNARLHLENHPMTTVMTMKYLHTPLSSFICLLYCFANRKIATWWNGSDAVFHTVYPQSKRKTFSIDWVQALVCLYMCAVKCQINKRHICRLSHPGHFNNLL